MKSVIETTISRHETFFSCVQAICYVLCFYGYDMALTQKYHFKENRGKYHRVISCTLQPLRYCLQVKKSS